MINHDKLIFSKQTKKIIIIRNIHKIITNHEYNDNKTKNN